jgi:hypothetical protein
MLVDSRKEKLEVMVFNLALNAFATFVRNRNFDEDRLKIEYVKQMVGWKCADQAEIDSGKEGREDSHNKLISQFFVQ